MGCSRRTASAVRSGARTTAPPPPPPGAGGGGPTGPGAGPPAERSAPGGAAPAGTAPAAAVDVMWGTDMTETVTLEEGRARVFVAVDHCSGEGGGSPAAGPGRRHRGAARA